MRKGRSSSGGLGRTNKLRPSGELNFRRRNLTGRESKRDWTETRAWPVIYNYKAACKVIIGYLKVAVAKEKFV